MPWPLASHFSAMLQQPRAAFRDPRLRACRVEKDARGQPRPWSGAFAVVYKALEEDGRPPVALRVFTTESPERHERYDAVSAYLAGLGHGSGPKRPACLVEFEYRDAAVRSASDGQWYPLIVMDWVEGLTLFEWVRARCLADDQPALATAAQGWLAVVHSLDEAGIAHGDLQPGNVLITAAGQIKLVDYDGMAVPPLFGRRNLEIGVEPYQHPARNAQTLLAPGLDHYSAAVIYVALRALAAEPGLWRNYVEGPGLDKLLFRRQDLRLPAGSPLCYDLARSPDAEVIDLVQRLLSLDAVPLDQVPPVWQWVDPYAEVERALGEGHWKQAVKLLNRRGRFRDAPEHLKPLIRQAYEHVCRQDAWAAVQAAGREINETCDRQLVGAWNAPAFEGFAPADDDRARYAAARDRVGLLEKLAALAAAEPPGQLDLAREQALAELAAGLPAGYVHRLETRCRTAHQRVRALAELEAAVRDPQDEAALVRAWEALVREQGEGLIPEDWQLRIDLARQRQPLLEKLAELSPNLPADHLDRRLLALWRGDLLDDCPQAQAWREPYQTAVRRKEVLRQLQTAVEAGDGPAVLQWLDEPCLAGYVLPTAWNGAIRAARDRIQHTAALVGVLEEKRRQDFLGVFDARLVRQYPDRFQNLQARLVDWVQSEVLPLEGAGLGPAVGRESLVPLPESPGDFRLRWTWPQPRICDECVVAVLRQAPEADDDPLTLPAAHRLAIDRRGWESGGGSRVLHTEPEWDGCCVAVWARVDLGFRTLFSHPLVLGVLDCRRGWRRWLRWGSRPATPRTPQRGGPPRG